jgi:hypothetical protein
LTAISDVVIPVNIGLIFGDGAEKIESNNTDLTINSGADINLTATADVNIPQDIGLTFGADTFKIESDGTNLLINTNGNTTTNNNVILQKFVAQPTVYGNEPRLCLFNVLSGGGGSQGYYGSLCFGGADTVPIGVDLSYTCAVISSQTTNDMTTTSTPGNLEFYTTPVNSKTAVKRMTINEDGTIDMDYQLQVDGSASETISDAYLNNNAGTAEFLSYSSASRDISIKAVGDIATGGTINYTSDRRAKKYIITTSSQDDFNVLKSIEIHKYKYIDELRRGTTEIHGVIAQELNEVYSEAITLTTDFIPNVYKYVKVIENNIVENYILCQLYEQSDLTIVLNVGDVLQIIDYYGRSVNCSIMEVIAETDTKPTQIKLISKGFNQRHFTDAQMDKVFIFGTQVTDYHKVIKERLIPLTISAVQYLANKVETMETSTNEHTNDVTVHKQTIGFSVDSSGEVISEENGNVEVEHMGTGVYKIIYTNYYLSYVPTIHVMPRIGMFGVFYTVQQREITNEYCIVDVGKFDDGGFSSGDCGLSIVVII